MNKPKIGLLPLYLELYDQTIPGMRTKIDAFYGTVASELGKRGVEVVTSEVCRVKEEFHAAVRKFEKAGVDAVATLHLAYSPSLESEEALASTKLPIIVIDTTPSYKYGPTVDPGELMYNHGIHGVQDMCNLLLRSGKSFFIEAGHWQKSDVLDRVVSKARSAKIASAMKNARVGLIGESFKGMGDFYVHEDSLKDGIGVQTVRFDFKDVDGLLKMIREDEVNSEISGDRERFDAAGIDPEVHRRSVLSGLLVRKWAKREGLTAFTQNFLSVDKASGFPTVPFLEASKAMAEGMGYAGEGDVLTAALVGALLSVYPDTSFTEMFCPDWENDSIFISHMGEMNINLCAEKPLLAEMDFPYTDADNPAAAYGRFRGGDAVLVNLAPSGAGGYTLIASKLKMLDAEGDDLMAKSIHGWFKPRIPAGDFLKAFSYAGGTHHSALIYGGNVDEIVSFGKIIGWKTVTI